MVQGLRFRAKGLRPHRGLGFGDLGCKVKGFGV